MVLLVFGNNPKTRILSMPAETDCISQHPKSLISLLSTYRPAMLNLELPYVPPVVQLSTSASGLSTRWHKNVSNILEQKVYCQILLYKVWGGTNSSCNLISKSLSVPSDRIGPYATMTKTFLLFTKWTKLDAVPSHIFQIKNVAPVSLRDFLVHLKYWSIFSVSCVRPLNITEPSWNSAKLYSCERGGDSNSGETIYIIKITFRNKGLQSLAELLWCSRQLAQCTGLQQLFINSNQTLFSPLRT